MQLPHCIHIALKKLTYGGTGRGPDGARVVDWLELQPGMKIADIGSGFGDFAMRFAEAVGESGAVYAIDTDPDLREAVTRRARESGLDQLRAVAARDEDPAIPEPIDLVFLSFSYHHLPERVRYFESVRLRIRPGGRVVILESKPGLLSRLIGHATPAEEVAETMAEAGYQRSASADIVKGVSIQAFTPADQRR
jgi:ubiquinone/menaquinone biosynthesis C-methylase UbiE